MASTADCKALLEREPALGGRGHGGWKRLSKRQTDDGVERIFSNKGQDCFVRVLESAEGLRVDRVADSLAGAGGHPKRATFDTPREGQVLVDLFAVYPPDLCMSEEDLEEWDTDRQSFRQEFSGTFVYNFDDEDDESRDEQVFYLGYESEGALYDQHSAVYELLVPQVLPGHDEDHLVVNDAEGVHCLTIPEGTTRRKIKKDMVTRFKACGFGRCFEGTATRSVWLDPLDPLLAPRLVDGPSMWEGLVAGTALGGREMIVLDWELRPAAAQAALQTWAAREGWRLAAPTPQMKLEPELIQRAHHHILVAVEGRIEENVTAATLLAGSPVVSDSRRAPRP